MRGNRGFTLVEIMIAAAVASIIGLGFMTMTFNASKGQNSVSGTADFQNFVMTLQVMAQSSNLCNVTTPGFPPLLGTTFSPGSLPNGAPPVNNPAGVAAGTGIDLSGVVASSGNVILNRLAPHGTGTAATSTIGTNGSLTITQFYLSDVSEVTPNTSYLGHLHIEASKDMKRNLGAGLLESGAKTNSGIPVLLTTTTVGAPPGQVKITSCGSGGGSTLTCAGPTWTAVGTGTEAFCVTTAAQGPGIVPNGILACAGNATPSHMCSANEWSLACNAGVFAPAVAEWSGSPMQYDNGGGGHTGLLMGPGGTGAPVCFAMQYWNTNSFTDSHPYRCCHN